MEWCLGWWGKQQHSAWNCWMANSMMEVFLSSVCLSIKDESASLICCAMFDFYYDEKSATLEYWSVTIRKMNFVLFNWNLLWIILYYNYNFKWLSSCNEIWFQSQMLCFDRFKFITKIMLFCDFIAIDFDLFETVQQVKAFLGTHLVYTILKNMICTKTCNRTRNSFSENK